MTVGMVGWAHSAFGRLPAPDTESLMGPVLAEALEHAELDPAAVDGVFVGVYNNGFSRQDFQAALAGVALPAVADVPAVRVENACATGAAALHTAIDFVEADSRRVAVVVGAEKMTGVPLAAANEVLLSACYVAEEGDTEHGFAGVFAGVASAYFDRYGDRSEELALIAAKNHGNAVRNPFAHIRKDLGFEHCNTASDANPYIAKPLRRTDCSPLSDGAAAVVVASTHCRDDFPRMVAFRGTGRANETLPLSRRDPTAFRGAAAAWRAAGTSAGVGNDDLDLVETHDCFTIAELIQYEAFGLAPAGEGHRLVRDGATRIDGTLPVNPSGGLKARGHPIGATGVSMHVMAAVQLTGEAGEMQVADAELAGVFNMGGAAVANYASVLERVR